MRPCDVDPVLTYQLDAAQSTDPVEAVLLLRQSEPAEQQPRDAEALMRWASGQDAAAEMNYMPRIGALVVRAQSHVIRELISQPAVEVASANRGAAEPYL